MYSERWSRVYFYNVRTGQSTLELPEEMHVGRNGVDGTGKACWQEKRVARSLDGDRKSGAGVPALTTSTSRQTVSGGITNVPYYVSLLPAAWSGRRNDLRLGRYALRLGRCDGVSMEDPDGAINAIAVV